MEEVRDRLVEKVRTLSDLELAVLVCLIVEQHCIIQTEVQLLESVERELKLVSWVAMHSASATNVFRSLPTCSASRGRCLNAMNKQHSMTLAVVSS